MHDVPVPVPALSAGGTFAWDLMMDLQQQQAHFAPAELECLLVENDTDGTVTVTDTGARIAPGATLCVPLPGAVRFQVSSAVAAAVGELRVTASLRGCCK